MAESPEVFGEPGGGAKCVCLFPGLVFSLPKKNALHFLFGSWHHGVHIFPDLQVHHGKG